MANLSNINNKFLVTTTGEVLIGQTSNNGNRLQITGADGASYIYLKTDVATTGGRIGFNGDDLRVFNQQASGELQLGTAGTSRVRINNSLVVFPTITELRGDVAAKFAIGNMGDASSQMMVSSRGFLTLNVSNTGSALDATERIRINSQGQTWIGGSSYTGSDIANGNTSYLNSLNAGAFSILHRNSSDAYIHFNSYYTSSGTYLSKYTGIGIMIGVNAATDNGMFISKAPSVSAGAVQTFETGIMQIGYGANNNVGIGVTSPSQKLQVDGGATGLNQGIPATSGTTQNGILRLTSGDAVYGETFDFGMNVGPTYAWIQSTNKDGLNTNYSLALNPNGGNVGIGTPSPEQKLHVEGRGIFDGGISSDILQIRNDNGGGVFGMTSNLFALDLASTSAFRIRQGSSVPFYLKSDGNVGIGTTTPSYKLEVSSKTRLYNVAIGGTDGGLYNVYSDSVVGINNLHLAAQGSGAVYVNSALARPMYINPLGGDVGIGTLTPRARLEVVGDTTIQNGVYTYQTGGYTSGATAINVDITVGNEGGGGNVFKIEAGFAHYYAMTYNSLAEWWCTSRGTAVVNTYILNAGTTAAGDWSASKPNATTLRVTKSAGTYGGGGKWWFKVTYIPF